MKYEISNGTLAIVPNEKDNSLVYEDDERYIIEDKPFKIMEDSCKYFGSTYEGRKESAKERTNEESGLYKFKNCLNNMADVMTVETLIGI